MHACPVGIRAGWADRESALAAARVLQETAGQAAAATFTPISPVPAHEPGSQPAPDVSAAYAKHGLDGAPGRVQNWGLPAQQRPEATQNATEPSRTPAPTAPAAQAPAAGLPQPIFPQLALLGPAHSALSPLALQRASAVLESGSGSQAVSLRTNHAHLHDDCKRHVR